MSVELRSPADILIRQTTPPGYTALDQVRSTDPDNGGIAIIFRTDFLWSPLSLPPDMTF